MKALIIGATGATGKDLVDLLLNDPVYTEIMVFVRRPSGRSHSKLTEVTTDFDKLGEIHSLIHGDVLFSCLGTTLKTAGSKENQHHIDHEIPLSFARIARQNGVSSLVLLSAYGASKRSRVFYSRIKGELEHDLAGLDFPQYIIFRPGLLLRKNSDRAGERMMAGLLGFLNTLGLLKKFRPLPTILLGEKMAKAPGKLPVGTHVVELEKIVVF